MPAHRLQSEINDLVAQFGQPLVVNETLHLKSLFGAIDKRPMRVAEVVPIVQRQHNRVLTMIKQNYPHGVYRLPSGGIRTGERILDALLRETYEETGLSVMVQRFLALIRYQIILPTGRTGRFTSYVFLVHGDDPVQPVDASERIVNWREVGVHDLRDMADALYNLRVEGELDWNDWGRFRSVVHRVAADILCPRPASPATPT